MGTLRFIEFQLPSLVAQPPEGDGWLHEIKWDGYRTELIVANGRARAFTRRGFDWSDRYAADRRGGRCTAGEVRDHRRRGRGARREGGLEHRPAALGDAAFSRSG